MKSLTVLYDGDCALCHRSRCWLSRQPARVEMTFLPQQSAEAQRRFARLLARGEAEEMVVISDDGEVWRGEAGWVICLWALRDYRVLAQRIGAARLRPTRRRVYRFVSRWRRPLSFLIGGHHADRTTR